jgi:hypothetical protein
VKVRPKLRRKKLAAAAPLKQRAPVGVLRGIIEAASPKNSQGSLNLQAMTVLAANNDPYRYDHENGHLEAQWFADQVARFLKPGEAIHLRGLHYRLVSVGDVLKPLIQLGKDRKPAKGPGKPYVNTSDDWVWLQQRAANAARWLGYVPFDRIKDERNAAPDDWTVKASFTEFSANIFHATPPDLKLPELDLSSVTRMPFSFTTGGTASQTYRLVIIGEKSSLADVLAPIAQQYNAELLLPTGESSSTMLWNMAARAAEDPRPCVVFYASDFDPAGRQMPISAARKLQAMKDLKLKKLRIEVHHICLTRDQVIEYNLPSTPLKETERRADKWREIMGREQTEIDALQALRPDVLRQIVTAAIEPFYDRTLKSRLQLASGTYYRTCSEILEAHPNYESWQTRIDDAMQQIEAAMDHVRAEMGPVENAIEEVRLLQLQAYDELSDVEFPPCELPMPVLNLDSPEPLFSTSDDYVTATAKLKAYKSMDGEGEED